MLTLRIVSRMFAAVLALAATHVAAQSYPTKPIRIVTMSVGGGADLHARLLAAGLSSALGQSVVVENRGGVGIAPETVAKASPDGYTLIVAGGTIWTTPLLQKTNYDMKDFAAVSLLDQEVNVLTVVPSLPVKNVQDLIVLAKSKPGAINYASGPNGTQIGIEFFKMLTGTNFARVPYSGTGPFLTGMMAGEAQLAIVGAGAVGPLLKSGRLKGLAVTTPKPSVTFPDLPTIAATVPGYEFITVNVLMAPVKTPTAIVNRLSQETARVLNQPDVKDKLVASAQEIIASTPADAATLIKADIARLSKVIAEAHLRSD